MKIAKAACEGEGKDAHRVQTPEPPNCFYTHLENGFTLPWLEPLVVWRPRGEKGVGNTGMWAFETLEKQAFRAAFAQLASNPSACLPRLLGSFTNWLLLAGEVGGSWLWNIPPGHRVGSGLMAGDF
jgi:hypothetical protein